MLKNLLIICTAFSAAYASGQFSVLYAPNSLLFKAADKIESADLENIIPASLGYPIEKSSSSRFFTINDPFTLPRSAISVIIDGVNSLKYEQIKAQSYAVAGEDAYQAIDAISAAIEDQNEIAADVQLVEGLPALEEYKQIFGDLMPKPEKSTNKLKTENKAHKQFLQQLSLINAIAESAGSIKLPAYVSLRVSVDSLLDDTPALTEALKLLSDSIEDLTKAYQKSTDGDVLIVSFASKSHPVVRIRRDTTPPANDINLAMDYSENYPIIFNIILWFSVVMIFTLLAISYAIAYMDPGRDSIIYRMTSIRIKKDN